jgi:hypothetical protein
MDDVQQLRKLKKGIWTCWLSLVILPIGIFFGAIGMCAGPGNGRSATAMLAVGVAGIAATIYSFVQVIRGFRVGNGPLRLFAILSLCSSILAGLFGALCSLEAWDYITYVFRR